MSKDLTIRQAGFLLILLSLSPAMRQLPNIIFGGKDNEILLVLISYLIIIGLTSCILYLMKKNQGKNIYEISNIVFGKIISKFLMIVIATWMLVLISSRINIYVFTIQLTMMPNTRAFIFILTMFALVFYAISKGMKTVFRISEFTLGMIILIIIFFIIFSLNNIRSNYILPHNIISKNISMNSINNIVFMGTNIVLLLFINDRINLNHGNISRIWKYIMISFVLTLSISLVSVGICGPNLIKKTIFPFYTAVKSISAFRFLERLEVLITLICILSDFIAICFYSIILWYCISWTFGIKSYYISLSIFSIIIYIITYKIGSTQFLFYYLYHKYIVNINSIIFIVITLIMTTGVFIHNTRFKHSQ